MNLSDDKTLIIEDGVYVISDKDASITLTESEVRILITAIKMDSKNNNIKRFEPTTTPMEEGGMTQGEILRDMPISYQRRDIAETNNGPGRQDTTEELAERRRVYMETMEALEQAIEGQQLTAGLSHARGIAISATTRTASASNPF